MSRGRLRNARGEPRRPAAQLLCSRRRACRSSILPAPSHRPIRHRLRSPSGLSSTAPRRVPTPGRSRPPPPPPARAAPARGGGWAAAGGGRARGRGGGGTGGGGGGGRRGRMGGGGGDGGRSGGRSQSEEHTSERKSRP